MNPAGSETSRSSPAIRLCFCRCTRAVLPRVCKPSRSSRKRWSIPPPTRRNFASSCSPSTRRTRRRLWLRIVNAKPCRSVGFSARPINRTSTRSWNPSGFSPRRRERNSCIPICFSSSTRNCASGNGSMAPTTPPRDVDSALKIAGGQSDWIGQHFDFLYAILVFAAALLCVALVQQLLRHRRVPSQLRCPAIVALFRGNKRSGHAPLCGLRQEMPSKSQGAINAAARVPIRFQAEGTL